MTRPRKRPSKKVNTQQKSYRISQTALETRRGGVGPHPHQHPRKRHNVNKQATATKEKTNLRVLPTPLQAQLRGCGGFDFGLGLNRWFALLRRNGRHSRFRDSPGTVKKHNLFIVPANESYMITTGKRPQAYRDDGMATSTEPSSRIFKIFSQKLRVSRTQAISRLQI